jgi:DNA-binding transcriptional regulator YiaG
MTIATKEHVADRIEQQMRRRIEERLSKLPKDQRRDLHKLCELLVAEEDEREQYEIARTLTEIIFPESIKNLLNDESIKEMAEARRRLDEYRKRVGHEIRRRRESMKMTQTELAERAGIPQSHVSRLERGKHAPTYVTLERVAKALETTPARLDPGFSE